jgi:dipeptidyl aminopeptidase/acylaminoacyl peptidase
MPPALLWGLLPALLWGLLPALLCWGSLGMAASRVERGTLLFDGVPDTAAEPADSLRAYLRARQAAPLGWSPRGQLLIATRFGDIDQLHVLEQPGGARRQITFLDEPITQAAFSPDPLRVGYWFLKDVGGNGNAQLFYQRLGEPAAKLLSDGKSANGAPVWSNSGREIAFFTTARDGTSADIDIVEPEAGTLPHLAVTGDNGGAWYPLDWSPDDRKLLVLKSVSVSESHLYVVDLSSGQKREVDPAPGKVGIAGAKFSRDGQGVYLISDRDSEFRRLRYVDLFAAGSAVLSDPVPGDVEELAISRDGHYLAFVGNEGGASKLNIIDLRAHQDLTPPRLPAAGSIAHLHFDTDGRRLVFGFASVTQPQDAYVLDVAANHLEAWTRSETGPVDTAKFVAPRLTQFPTFDRQESRARQIPVYVYEPPGPGPHPVLITLHGGPEGQFRPTFDPWLQYVVKELGFAVVAPNVRGSSGYGKTYQAMDDAMQRDDAVKDVGALIVWVGLQGAFDPKHVVVAGESHGGYLALAALENFGDRLSGAVDLAGMSDFISFLTNTAADRQAQRRAEYGDERDPDVRAYLRRLSPLTNADRIARPLLVMHGKNDAEVPVSESEQLVNRLRARGAAVWFLEATDEGRVWRRQPNLDAYYRTFALFLKSLR